MSIRSILITGGTGSFGRRLLRYLLDNSDIPRIVILARGEFAHFEIQNSLTKAELDRVRFFIGDVRDRDRLMMAFRDVDVVFHAAAQKQVPLAEYNPFECINTNVIGAENVVHAAIRCDVRQVIALSTDKAVNPINLYGASKLASDKIFVAANATAGAGGTRFSVVRYGNVLGSRGSVIPYFRKLKAEGGDHFPITDTRMTRFWITLDEAVRFTLSCLDLMRGGEIFVPRIPSTLITDVARAIDPDMPHKVVGIRPGEKLHEIMITEHAAPHTLDMGDRYVIEPEWTFRTRKSLRDKGYKPVPEGFAYSSDTNDQWLDGQALRSVLETL
ncbi:UDP-N-acetylglucosamine 4,6-dehydratase (inverting) [Yunchengibacter salinarum]|uniref:UDP-N-acetylglucosamine 4,6-dehydratase (inverting) n=1 Tax=Yunchengibacter salinarum TaxID=3133399 RepID=UPI0035B575CE